MNKQRYLVVVSGPSGCGKDTVVRHLMKTHDHIEESVSATTRAPREGEQHGINYFFISTEEFEEYIRNNQVLEYTRYVGNYYGTLKSEVDRRIESEKTAVLVIEVEGAARIKEIYPECTTVFVLPPSMEELGRRLRSRGTETEERVQQRLKRAEEEIQMAGQYDFQLVNEDVEKCAAELYEIIRKRQSEE